MAHTTAHWHTQTQACTCSCYNASSRVLSSHFLNASMRKVCVCVSLLIQATQQPRQTANSVCVCMCMCICAQSQVLCGGGTSLNLTCRDSDPDQNAVRGGAGADVGPWPYLTSPLHFLFTCSLGDRFSLRLDYSMRVAHMSSSYSTQEPIIYFFLLWSWFYMY